MINRKGWSVCRAIKGLWGFWVITYHRHYHQRCNTKHINNPCWGRCICYKSQPNWNNFTTTTTSNNNNNSNYPRPKHLICQSWEICLSSTPWVRYFRTVKRNSIMVLNSQLALKEITRKSHKQHWVSMQILTLNWNTQIASVKTGPKLAALLGLSIILSSVKKVGRKKQLICWKKIIRGLIGDPKANTKSERMHACM